MDELRAAVRDLATAPSAEGADVFVQRLAAAEPDGELADFISQTLELTALHQVSDSSGTPVRWRLIDRLLGLGFPHPLHVTPEDLDYHRYRALSPGSVPAALTMVVALLSMLWSFGLAALAGLSAPAAEGWTISIIGLALALCGGHGLAAFVSAKRITNGEPAPLLEPLKWSLLLGFAVVAGAQLIDNQGAAIASVLGAPAMLTALLCAVTASVISPRPAPPVPEPERSRSTVRSTGQIR